MFDGKEIILYCDNLTTQFSDEFLKAVKEIGGIVWFGPTWATNTWQPVDCGIGRMLIQTVSRIQDDWLEYDDNIDLWLGNADQKLTAKKKKDPYNALGRRSL